MADGTQQQQSSSSRLDLRVGNKYRMGKKIGAGSFGASSLPSVRAVCRACMPPAQVLTSVPVDAGDIYMGANVISGEEVAIKLEPAAAKHPQLQYEVKVYKALAGGAGIPFVRYYGTEGDYNAMVMDLLGPSLEDLFNFCGRKFTLKTVLLLADQMISRVEYVHSRNFLHRDIKPDNFVMGLGRRGNQVHLIDFGLAKKFRDPRSHLHIPYRENKSLTGTARYASINTHLGVEQARRDDLEGLLYVLIYFLHGELPWQGIKAATKKNKYEKIMEKKMTTTAELLCKRLPKEFVVLMSYVRALRFDETPDYAYMKKVFRDLFVREEMKWDYVFDWSVQRPEKEAKDKDKRTADDRARRHLNDSLLPADTQRRHRATTRNTQRTGEGW
ncbi:unnamed protein product [Mycena citricolor]|uniref:non-specific serine/threonine protein kinase n=1 Tax=Mycena citricolor TaxID=2018698 RepID=A0AAD2Q4P2_9AGAR|nr:unnamed protein product [Mycena citricolor]